MLSNIKLKLLLTHDLWNSIRKILSNRLLFIQYRKHRAMLTTGMSLQLKSKKNF